MTTDSEIAHIADSAAPAMARMRRFTTATMLFVVAGYVFLVAGASPSPARILSSLVVGALVCWQSVYWEHGAPPAIAITAFVASYAFLWIVVGAAGNPIGGVSFAVSAALVTSAAPFMRWWWSALAAALAVLPVLAFSGGGKAALGAVGMVIAAAALFRANRFGFRLYVEIDEARGAAAELAVMRERYRFAADLHDIQGQALHVSRLQLQLADKLLDKDPALARGHLREAEQLIGETLAETRRLAYGERTVTLAGEVANSESLIRAAGIVLEVRGEAPVAHRLDDLFGLVVREATTNLLRHAHAEHVGITFGPDSVRIVNDGATDKTQTLRGLARLGERFAAAGGTLVTSHDGETFATSARGSGAVA